MVKYALSTKSGCTTYKYYFVLPSMLKPWCSTMVLKQLKKLNIKKLYIDTQGKETIVEKGNLQN